MAPVAQRGQKPINLKQQILRTTMQEESTLLHISLHLFHVKFIKVFYIHGIIRSFHLQVYLLKSRRRSLSSVVCHSRRVLPVWEPYSTYQLQVPALAADVATGIYLYCGFTFAVSLAALAQLDSRL